MRSGCQWLALDAEFFAKPFPVQLRERFGFAGVGVFVALLCAAKRAHPQGEISYRDDADALRILHLEGASLVNDLGVAWTLDDLWKFTGQQKQTRIKREKTRIKCQLSHWGRWQETIRRDQAAERMSRSRARNTRNGVRTGSEHDANTLRTDKDIDIDTPLPPKGGGRRRFASNGNGNGQTPTGPVIADWQPEPPPDDVIASSAVANLRANPSGKSQ